jgi:hypothetical protein
MVSATYSSSLQISSKISLNLDSESENNFSRNITNIILPETDADLLILFRDN